MAHLTCTYCGGNRFYEGPSGGGSINVLCSNPDCRHWFNDTGFGLDDLDKIEPTKEERAEQKKDQSGIIQEKIDARIEDGKRIYKTGGKPFDCLSREADTRTGTEANSNIETFQPVVHYGDLERLCGYLEAMKEDHQNIAPSLPDLLGKQ